MYARPNGKALNEDTCPVAEQRSISLEAVFWLTVIDEGIYGRPKLVMTGGYFFQGSFPSSYF